MQIFKKLQIKRFLSAVIILLLLTATPLTAINVKAADETVQSTSVDLKALAEQKAKTLTSLYGLDSVSYALIDNGNIILSEKYYSPTKIYETKTSDVYGIGSISKIFTTVAVLQLSGQGKLSLDTPVVVYLPEFTMADDRYKDITVRMLLNHSSGLMGSTLNNSMLFKDKDTVAHDNFLESLKSQRLKAAPGSFSVYCNDGFTLAEILVEKVSGISFSQYIKDNITTPLGLKKILTPVESIPAGLLSGTYAKLLKAPLPAESVLSIGAGGIYSSADDLCRFSQLFMAAGSYVNVLSAQASASMQNPEYAKGLNPAQGSSLTYGLGWDSVTTAPYESYGIKALVKGGDTLTYHSSLTVLPEENMAIAVMSSGGSSLYNQIFAQEIMLEALKSKGRIAEIKPDETFSLPKKTAIPADQKQYEGYYGNFTNMLKVTMKDTGTMTLTSLLTPDASPQIFYYTGNGKYYYTDGSYYLSFEKNTNGNTYIYFSGFTNLPGLGQSPSYSYLAQKLTENPLTAEVEKVWEARSGKTYFLLSERYSSQIYVLSSPYSVIPMTEGIKGYWINTEIIDKDNAKSPLQIPGSYGRDLIDYRFFRENGIEYLDAKGNIFLSSDSLKSLPAKTAKYTIGEKGYASWYKLSSNTASKKITVTVPANASFAVYNEKDVCITNYYLNKNKTITLPKNGYIVFMGDAGSVFHLNFAK
ncbi:serine hydrolase domain-containing protein [Anaerocolumna sp. AGMB13020]|uniref:serine hydrolase domain-containing protein n=1 Tax=Anaerocolumna sp. AGMB13020 TaxID=3081750 RepID=UPI002953B7BA|nr:serine hydrolase domain-containing protein [Anaerocolumna sp. AGMB13020]WOO37513.1 serine hydrolase domain-containing protein [Anaerocolumna sp. AGMB13020]